MVKELTFKDLSDQLIGEGFSLPDDFSSMVLEVLEEKEDTSSPWYVRFFIGLSAWIAALLLVLFLSLADILTNEAGALFVGLIFIAIAVVLNRAGPRNDFSNQLGLALSLAGQVLVIMALFYYFEDTFLLPLLILILESILIFAYEDQLHRFLSTIVILGTILMVMFDQKALELVHVVILGLAIGSTVFQETEIKFQLSGSDRLIKPVGYAMIVFLLGLLILPLIEDLKVRYWWFTAVLLLFVLLYLIWEISSDLKMKLTETAMPWLIAGCVILVFPALRMPGILGALIILLLGFWRSNKVLIGLASVFLLFYLGAFYYSLEWTLLVKSIALMLTGVVLFLVRLILHQFAPGGAS
jgi:uncharacterized membrane protein